MYVVSSKHMFGFRFQEVFVKKPKIAKDVKASTHLICVAPEGDKYYAAMKWGVPAVTHDWLLECVKSGKRAPEDAFKVDQKNSHQLDGKKIIKDLLSKFSCPWCFMY